MTISAYNGPHAEECWTVGIDDRTINERRFAIFPNPASDVVRVRFSDSSASVGMTLKVMDVLGRDMTSPARVPSTGSGQALQGEELLRIDVSGWAEGVYFVTVNFGDGTRCTGKLVVER